MRVSALAARPPRRARRILRQRQRLPGRSARQRQPRPRQRAAAAQPVVPLDHALVLGDQPRGQVAPACAPRWRRRPACRSSSNSPPRSSWLHAAYCSHWLLPGLGRDQRVGHPVDGLEVGDARRRAGCARRAAGRAHDARRARFRGCRRRAVADALRATASSRSRWPIASSICPGALERIGQPGERFDHVLGIVGVARVAGGKRFGRRQRAAERRRRLGEAPLRRSGRCQDCCRHRSPRAGIWDRRGPARSSGWRAVYIRETRRRACSVWPRCQAI